MPAPPAPFSMADGEGRNLKLNQGELTSPQPYAFDPADNDPSSSTAVRPVADLPTVSQGRSGPLPCFLQPAHVQPTQPLPSPSPAAVAPTQPLPARSDSLTHPRKTTLENTKALSPTTQQILPIGLSSPQSAHTTIASVSDRSSNGDTFSSWGSGSYLSNKSSKSSFAWDVPTRNQSVTGKKNVQELEPVEERNLNPLSHQEPRGQNVTAPEMPTLVGMGITSPGYGDNSFEEEEEEEEARPADQIIYEIMSHIKRIPDLIAAAQINTGFYGVFCDRGIGLVKPIILATSPAAWEYMEMTYPTPEHPSSYLQKYRQSLSCLSAVKNTLFLRSESTLKPDTIDGLMGANLEKEQKVDAALWRMWTFCERFGGESGRDGDGQSQMAWLQHGSNARIPNTPASFGIGNGKGLSIPELLLIAELWNALSTLLQEAFRLPSEDHRYSLFAYTDAQYPEELYLLEWVSHVMTFGLGPISLLASGSFEAAQNLGFANWSPPREFGTRQAFLKNAVASAYRRRLQQETENKAAAAGLSMRATHRALATTTRRPVVRPAPSSETMRSQPGVLPRKTVGSGAPTRAEELLPPRTPQTQSPPIPQYNVTRPRQAAVPQYPAGREGGLQLRQGPDYLRPEDVHAGMVSFLDPETRPGSTVNHSFSPNAPQPSPSLSADSSEHSYYTRAPSSPPLRLSDRQQLSPSSHKYAVVDPVDKALALLVNEMGFSLAASKKALAATDDGSGLNIAKAIALLQEGLAASSSEKIPVIDTKDLTKSSSRFGGMKFRFGSKPPQPAGNVLSPPPVVKSPPQPVVPKRTFGELRPTKKERAAYAELSKEEATGIKTDVFRAQVYRDAFGNLFHGGREEKPRKGSASTISAAEVGGRPLSARASWSIRSLDVASTSSIKMESAAAASDVRSLKT